MTDNEKPAVTSGIRAIGEQDRSDEFKARRDQFIKMVDSFMGQVDAACGSDNPELIGLPVQLRPGIWREIVGRSGPRTHLSVEHIEDPGIYYFVDEKKRPTLQVVEKEVTGLDTLVTRVWEIAGSDPLERMRFGPDAGYATSGNMIDLATVVYRDNEFGDDKTELRVCGDGAVKTGLPATEARPAVFTTLSDPNQMFAAEIILDELGQQFFGQDWANQGAA